MKKLTGILVAVALAVAIAGCGADDGDKNVCERACDKLESCGPGTTCTIGGSCDAGDEAVAQCILDTPCEEILSCVGL